MSVTAKSLFNPLQIVAAETTQYVAPAATHTIIDKLTGTNTTAAPQTITVKLVQSGGAVGAGNTIVSTKSIAPGECYTFPEIVGHVLNPGDFMSTLCSAGASITLRASGREIS